MKFDSIGNSQNRNDFKCFRRRQLIQYCFFLTLILNCIQTKNIRISRLVTLFSTSLVIFTSLELYSGIT
jgi:hypothetical protein